MRYEQMVLDNKSEVELEAMDRESYKTDRQRTRLEIRIRQANDDIAELELQRDQAVRDEVREKIAETESAMTANAATVDKLTAELRTALDAIDRQRHELAALDTQLGRETRPYMKNIQRVVATNLKLETWVHGNQKQFFGQPLAAFLERQFQL